MTQTLTTAEAAALLRERDHFLILTHLRPDVDQARLLAEARALCPFAVLAQAGMTLSC